MGQIETHKKYHIAIGPPLDGKIPPGDSYWHEFNGAFRNEKLTQLEIATKIYDGHPITTCCDPQWRKADNYKLGQHIGLDFDTEDKHSTIAHLMKDPFVSEYGSIIYTTPSHTPDKPRARVLFMLSDPIHQGKNYTRAASALLWLFGTADRQCKDPVRFFYGSRPGAGKVEWLNRELPLQTVRELIEQCEAVDQAKRRTPKRRTQYKQTDQQDIADALDALDPWALGYQEWVSVLMAIHSEMPGPSGLSLAESWGDGYPREIQKKWEGFKSNGNANGQVTIATLFALAKERGGMR